MTTEQIRAVVEVFAHKLEVRAVDLEMTSKIGRNKEIRTRAAGAAEELRRIALIWREMPVAFTECDIRDQLRVQEKEKAAR